MAKKVTYTIVAIDTHEMQPITEYIVMTNHQPENVRIAQAMKRFLRNRASDHVEIVDVFEGELRSKMPGAFTVNTEIIDDILKTAKEEA